MNRTTIEWTTAIPGVAGFTFNPCTGCGGPEYQCFERCYARRMAHRLHLMGRPGYEGFKPTEHPERWNDPGKVKKGGLVFCGSMTDWLHKDFSNGGVGKWLLAAHKYPQHFYLFLTKRAERLTDLPRIAKRLGIPWPLPNVGLGVSVEDQDSTWRILALLKTLAALRFVSVEPCLSGIDVTPWLPPFTDCDHYSGGCSRPENVYASTANPSLLPGLLSCDSGKCVFGRRGLDWILCGAESGPGARPMHPDWARSLRDQCKAAGTPFLFKSWGAMAPVSQLPDHGHCITKEVLAEYAGGMDKFVRGNRKDIGRTLDGVVHDAVPDVIKRHFGVGS